MKVQVGNTVRRQRAIDTDFQDVPYMFDYVEEGKRRRPQFNKRLRRSFPHTKLKLVWDNRRCCWLLYQEGAFSRQWFVLVEQHREPTEDLIDRIRVGRIGGRRINNKIDYQRRCLEEDMQRENKDKRAGRLLRKEMLEDTKYYLPALTSEEYTMKRDVPVIPERYTPGWSKDKKCKSSIQ